MMELMMTNVKSVFTILTVALLITSFAIFKPILFLDFGFAILLQLMIMKIPTKKRNSEIDASIGVNLRVTAHSNQGGRKYMEDMFCVAYQPTSDEKDLLYAYFGIFDGHGGREAALYAKTHLMDHIVSQKNFWSDDDELILKAIRDGFISVHHAMWRELDTWPKTQSGLPSTSGTTASVAFVRRGKLYIGHVGDSGIVLGYQDPDTNYWLSRPLTRDHKPESPAEHARIQECGGKVVTKSGVPRVVWNRPRIGHRGPVRRSTPIDEIPFLAVARSLGDLWSYNSEQDEFVVSPVPDVAVIEIDVSSHRCLILGSDGLWNMLQPQDAVNSVFYAEKSNEQQYNIAAAAGNTDNPNAAAKNWMNPSKRLVDRALDRWYSNNLRADNTSVVTVVIDPPGPPRTQKSSDQYTKSGARFKAVYTRHPEPKPSPSRSSIGHHYTNSPGNETPVMPPGLRLPVRTSLPNESNAAAYSNVASADRNIGRRKKPLPKVPSKTSRVFVRAPHSSASSQNLKNEQLVPSSSPSTSRKVEDSSKDVQINEISSSCESVKTNGADTNSSTHAAPEPKKQGRLRPSSSGTSGKNPTAQGSLKRASRQSNTTECELPKKRKVEDQPLPSQTRSSSTEKTGVVSINTTGRSLRNRKTQGKRTTPTKKPPRLAIATNKVKDVGKKAQPKTVSAGASTIATPTALSSPPSRSTRATSKDASLTNSTSLSEIVTDSNSSDPQQKSRGVEVSKVDLSETNGVTNKSQRSLRQSRKPIESQDVLKVANKGKRGQPIPPKAPKQTNAATISITISKKKPLAAKQIIILPEGPSNVALKRPLSKISLKRLQGNKSIGSDPLASQRNSLKKGGAEDVPAERTLRSAPAAGSRVTRSMKH